MLATHTPESALKSAVERIGSQAAMAKLCGVKQPSVWKWVHRCKPLPAEHVLKVEAATGISRHDLRPDIYPRDMSLPASSGPAGDMAPAAAGLPAAGAASASPSLESPAA